MKKVIMILWQFPQWILGLIVRRVFKSERVPWDQIASQYPGVDAPVFIHRGFGQSFGVALGEQIVISWMIYSIIPGVVRHEYGHVQQSRILGPLYLPTVALASIAMNIISRVSLACGRYGFASHYYNRWPENWADRLGGVKR